jgi:integrase
MKNLQSFFKEEQDRAGQLHHLLDGKITLYIREKSAFWQARFTMPNGEYIRLSTGHYDLEEAKVQSVILFETLKVKIRLGTPLRIKTFGDVARLVLREIRASKQQNKHKKIYRDYVFVIQKYLLPFFGKKEIIALTADDIHEFEAWRVTVMGKIPKASTERNHSSAYNRIMNYARSMGYLPSDKPIPPMKVDGPKGQARPAFTQQEIDYLLEFMKTWENEKGVFYPDNRKLCRCYVEFLVYTGIRHGTEALPIRWKHFQWHYIKDKKYLRVWVSGKTGPRFLIAKHVAIEMLTRLYQWQGLKYETFDDLLNARLDRRVFVTPENYQPLTFRTLFECLMESSNLLKNEAGETRTLYSLRHTYATFALSEGLDIHTLARQMGTSIAMLEKHYSKITPMLSAEKLAF